MTLEDALMTLWTTGKKAQYALYEGRIFVDGLPCLVETGTTPVISRGDVIPDAISVRVAKQVSLAEDPIMLTLVDEVLV